MAIQTDISSFISIEKMVSRPTWKEVLFDLVSSNRIDPWNLDIVRLADAFTVHVKKLEQIDFVLEANIILAASILLRYKSDYLKSFAYPEIVQDMVDSGLDDFSVPPDFPEIALAARIPPRSPVTLDGLVAEMERVIKYDETERVKVPRGSITETFDFEISGHDVEGDILSTFERVKEISDRENWALFSRLTEGKEFQSIIYTLICLLYLVQRELVDLRQDELFGEIFIKVLNRDSHLAML